MALPHRTAGVLLCVTLALVLTGCGGEEPIRSYTVPREPEPKRTLYRILGALYPADSPVWYFKFSGTLDELTQHESEWNQFITSVKYQGESKLPEFTLPKGWVRTGPRTTTRMGITTTTDEVVKIGGKDAALEVTITNIPGGGLNQNLARWADQVDADYDPKTLGEAAVLFPAVGVNGLRVDFQGPKNPAAGPMMGKKR